MLNSAALEALTRQLSAVLAEWRLGERSLGRVEFVRRAAEESAALFKEVTAGRPSAADAYEVAMSFVRGVPLDEDKLHLLAGALCVRVREFGRQMVMGNRRFQGLLDVYQREADKGDLWILTWFGLLCSYFEFNPQGASSEEMTGWGNLRSFLLHTWPLIDREAGTDVVPDWVRVLRTDPELLGENAAHRYGLEYARGDMTGVNRLSADLGIPESSWFWHSLVLSAVKRSTEQSDEPFRHGISQLLGLIQKRPVYRDEALEVLLTRYHQCSTPVIHKELRDYVVRKDVWRNPKLRAAGMATAWNRVSDGVWRMVLQWVNEANLRDFFAVLAARRNSDEGRLDFWSQYLEQITWTRLIFSSGTKQLAQTNEGIRNLIAREEDSYAMISPQDIDAFMMQLGDYVFIEFSRQPNAAYAYKADELPFDPYARQYTGTSSDLKYGFHGVQHRATRITHEPRWEHNAGSELRRLGIRPDTETLKGVDGQRASVTRTYRATKANTAPESNALQSHASRAKPFAGSVGIDVDELRSLLEQYPSAAIRDKRGASGGRLWVVDPRQNKTLAAELKRLGFKWASTRDAWYLPGN